ncbi:hypothetical protein [Thermaerobacter composti]|uniref:Tail assembly chaperone n=1 Tax=Thermaerobacter composti TaxID=554949 RepID=A0ABZ0QTK7_9FIRM|nr:hypothetical protein [Thermaerobacter composti]WPD20177.1 hypothetical protein Q5761_05985 [Thermaerobacter composti]
MDEDRVITLEEIRQRARGEIVDLPDWDGQGTIRVRLRKVDLTPVILQHNFLPNALKVKVQEAFEGKPPRPAPAPEVDLDLHKLMPALDAIAKEALVEPTYEQITEILPLTLTQKLAILEWVTKDLKALESFRGES